MLEGQVTFKVCRIDLPAGGYIYAFSLRFGLYLLSLIFDTLYQTGKQRTAAGVDRDVFHAPPVAADTLRVSIRKPAKCNETASVICERIQVTALIVV